MHSQVGFSLHSGGVEAQALSNPSTAHSATQARPAASQSAHDVTIMHSLTMVQGPQQPSTTLGTLPLGHSGGAASQMTLAESQ